MAIEFKSFIKGDTLPVFIELKVNGVPENITGAKIFVTMKTDAQMGQPDSGAALEFEYAVPPGPDALVGKAAFSIPHTLTNIPPDKYWMDMQRVIPGAPPDVWTFFRRRVEVVQQVTEDVA